MTAKTKTKPTEQTAAEIVEPAAASLVLTQFQPGLSIEGNFAALRAYVNERVADYVGVIVADEYVSQAKHDRAALNALVKDIDSRRLEAKRQYVAPVTAFEDEIKSILAPAKEASAAIDAQIKAFEERERVAKRAELVKHWEDFAGVLANAVSFEQIEDPKWALKSASLMSAFEAIEARVDRIAEDYETLDGLNLTHLDAARAEFVATLDLSRAIARSKTLDEQAAKAAQLESDRQAIIAERAEAEAIAKASADGGGPVLTGAGEQDAIIDHIAASTPEAREYVFTITCTRDELDIIIAACKTIGLTGKVRPQ